MGRQFEAGKHICLEVSRFRDLIAAGVFKRKPNGRYNLDEIREAYLPAHAKESQLSRCRWRRGVERAAGAVGQGRRASGLS